MCVSRFVVECDDVTPAVYDDVIRRGDVTALQLAVGYCCWRVAAFDVAVLSLGIVVDDVAGNGEGFAETGVQVERLPAAGRPIEVPAPARPAVRRVGKLYDRRETRCANAQQQQSKAVVTTMIQLRFDRATTIRRSASRPGCCTAA